MRIGLRGPAERFTERGAGALDASAADVAGAVVEAPVGVGVEQSELPFHGAIMPRGCVRDGGEKRLVGRFSQVRERFRRFGYGGRMPHGVWLRAVVVASSSPGRPAGAAGWENRWGPFTTMNPSLCPAVAGTPELARCPDEDPVL